MAVLINYMALKNNKKCYLTKTIHRKSRLSSKKSFSSEKSPSIINSAKHMIGWQKQK